MLRHFARDVRMCISLCDTIGRTLSRHYFKLEPTLFESIIYNGNDMLIMITFIYDTTILLEINVIMIIKLYYSR